MKILIVSQYFWPEHFRINNVVEALQRVGCCTTILTGQPNYPDGRVFRGYSAWNSNVEIHSSGSTIVRVPLVPRGKGSGVRLFVNYLSFITSSVLVGYWRLRGEKFDIIFVYGTSPILQALAGVLFRKLIGTPLVLWVQDLWPDSLSATGYVRNRGVLRCVAGIVEWIYRKCDLILVQSRGFVASVSHACPQAEVAYYPNPGDIDREAGGEPIANPAQLPKGFNVTFGGNLGAAQSLETILDAAEILRSASDVNILIFGSGSRFGWTGDEIKRRSLTNVHLLGRFDSRVVVEAMSRSDALLVCLRNREGLNLTIPSKLSTYLGLGRPIIACMNGEGADIVRMAGAGLICEAENADQLAEAILKLKATPQSEREAMGIAGRRYYDEHFDLKKLTQVLLGHFQNVSQDYGLKKMKVLRALND